MLELSTHHGNTWNSLQTLALSPMRVVGEWVPPWGLYGWPHEGARTNRGRRHRMGLGNGELRLAFLTSPVPPPQMPSLPSWLAASMGAEMTPS